MKGSEGAPNNLLELDLKLDMVEVLGKLDLGARGTWGTVGVWVLCGGGMTTHCSGKAGGSTGETVARGVGKENWMWGVAGVAGSPPGTICGVGGHETWVMSAITVVVALSRS